MSTGERRAKSLQLTATALMNVFPSWLSSDNFFLVHYLNFLTQDKVSRPKKRTGWCFLLQKEAMMLTSTSTSHLAISNTLVEVGLNASSSTYQQCSLEQVT